MQAWFLFFCHIYNKQQTMARRKINPENKKQRMSIVVSLENFEKLKELDINNSKFVNWLLEEHFNILKKGGSN